MALIYALVRIIAVALYKLASWRHGRAKKQLEKADASFRKIESACKTDEVASGRPAEFMKQFNLMKEFEKRDKANQRWQKSAKRLNNRDRFASWLAGFTGRKLPYLVGLFDMAIVEFVYRQEMVFSTIQETVQRYL